MSHREARPEGRAAHPSPGPITRGRMASEHGPADVRPAPCVVPASC